MARDRRTRDLRLPAGDELLDFAEAHGQKVHGHTLLWYLAPPDWVTEHSWTLREQSRPAKEHIQTVAGTCRRKPAFWALMDALE